jgi:hypothetical protein
VHPGVSFLGFVFLLSACASAPARSDPQTPEPAASQKPEAGGAAAGGKTLAEHKKDFMSGCSSKVPNATEYCECSWEQMTKLFTAEDMSTAPADDPRLTKLKAMTEASCTRKLPEDLLHTEFMRGCSGDEPKLAGYCECTWAELKKSVGSGDLADPEARKSDRFGAAKKTAIKACGPKLPEEIPRQNFMKGCVTADAYKPFCGCVWKTMRAEMSAAEIEAGLFDVEGARDKLTKACGKLKPPK